MQPITDISSQSKKASGLLSTEQSARPLKKKHSPFMEAAGMVLSVGFGVLRVVAKGIKASVGLLMQHKSITAGRVAPGTMKATPDKEIQEYPERR